MLASTNFLGETSTNKVLTRTEINNLIHRLCACYLAYGFKGCLLQSNICNVQLTQPTYFPTSGKLCPYLYSFDPDMDDEMRDH